MPRPPAYKILLKEKIIQLYLTGFTVIERFKLMAWYDKEQIRNTVWRDIKEEFDDYCGNEKVEIKLRNSDPDGNYILIRTDCFDKLPQ